MFMDFRDSYLMLPSSLSSLCKAFNNTNFKDIFPFEFVNKTELNYIGEVPNIKYFNNISLTDYDNYVERFKL